MALGSTVPAVRSAVVDLLEANAALAGVQVSRVYPGENNIRRESVYIDRITGSHRIPVFKAGRKPREERYTLTIVVFVASDGADPETVELRAFALLQEVEDMLADDPTLGGVDGVLHATAGEFRPITERTATGDASLIEFDIEILARLA